MRAWALSAVAAVVAVVAFLLVPAERVPWQAARVLGGADRPIEIAGGTVYRLRAVDGPIDPAAVPALSRSLRIRAATDDTQRVTVDVDGVHVRVDVVGRDRFDLDAIDLDRDEIGRALTSGRRFSMTRVVHAHPFSKAIYDALADEPSGPIEASLDMWRHHRSDDPYYDYYLVGRDRAELERTFERVAAERGLALDPELTIAYEAVLPGDLAPPAWRSYVIVREPALTSGDIATARVEWNPYSNQPEVAVDLTDQGAERFADLTAAAIGHKLAIMVDGRITSAPIVQDAIRGGRTVITMGRERDFEAAQLEAESLVADLRAGDQPVELDYIDHTTLAPSLSATRRLLVRGGFALGVGLAALFVLAVGARLTRRIDDEDAAGLPRARIGAAPRLGQLPLVRLAVTVAAPAAVVLASARLTLPTLDGEAMDMMLGYGADSGYSVLALGLAPILVAFVLVELAACAVPAWRRLRTGGPAGRARLAPAVASLTMALALLQGSLVAIFLRDMGALRTDLPLVATATALTLAGGVFALIVLARVIDRWGLGNGYSVLTLVALFDQARIVDAQLDADPTGAGTLLLGAAVIAGIIIATLWIGRRRPARDGVAALPGPIAGAVPLFMAFWLVNLYLQLAFVVSAPPPQWLGELWPSDAVTLALHLGFTLLFCVLFGLWFGHPASWRDHATRLSGADIAAEHARRAMWRAINLAALYLSVVLVAYFALRSHAPTLYFELPALLIGAAVAADLTAEWRARIEHRDLVEVWPLHRPTLAPYVSDALAARGIECHLRGLRHRSMLHVFGAYVPVMVMVPAARADEARAYLRDTLTTQSSSPA